MENLKAVIYARYSSNSQREESIEGQIRDCTAYAERNGYMVIGAYADRAISGTTDDRPEFQKMIKDSKRKQFDLVIVWKLDRFARNRYVSAKYKAQLRQNGVRVISANETISDGAAGILTESILEGMAEWYSENLKENVIRGLSVNAEKCKWNGGTLPIGYVVDEEQHLQPNRLTAPYVVEAFKMYDEGYTLTQIRDHLNGKGLTNTKGRPLTYGSIQHMLSNRCFFPQKNFSFCVGDGLRTSRWQAVSMVHTAGRRGRRPLRRIVNAKHIVLALTAYYGVEEWRRCADFLYSFFPHSHLPTGLLCV